MDEEGGNGREVLEHEGADYYVGCGGGGGGVEGRLDVVEGE